jgi:Leucine-rich repeat (LRR) protein
MSVSTLSADSGLHTSLIRQRLPGWVAHSAPADIRRLRPALLALQPTDGPAPAWLAAATPALRQALGDTQRRSRTSHQALARTLKGLKSITEFARPLLVQALNKRFGHAPDVDAHVLYYLRYRQPVQEHTLLQAALLNFEGNEDFTDLSLGQTSALAPKGALLTDYAEPMAAMPRAAYRYSETLNIAPADFAALCRTLDLGEQYQAHLREVFESPTTKAQVRDQMIAAQRDQLELSAHIAAIKGEISASAHTLIKALVAGTERPELDGRPVRYSQLSILGCILGEVLLIQSSAADARLIAWVPGAPLYPLKEYASLAAFEADLAVNLRSGVYQQLFAGFVAHDQAPAFLRRLKSRLFTFKWNPQGFMQQVYDDQINLDRREVLINGALFDVLYERHLQRLKDNARALAVPTAEADRKAAQERHEHWLSIGLNLLNVAAFVVPGLGEVMLVVAAIQLGLEVYHGIEAWKQGDTDAAWGHLESVALNLAFMSALAGTGVAAGRAPAIQVSRWVDGMVPVKLPNGEARLWAPDLTPYRSNVVLDPALRPNAQGQYQTAGKTYVRLGSELYEQHFDTRAGKWRITHPLNSEAYQPLLEHNNAGAWRHTHENPLEWNRLTLLRRLGHQTEGFSDATLVTVGDISNVPDDVLRRVHMDSQPVPAALADTLRHFRAEREAGEVIEQLRSGVGLDGRYEYALPLVVQMPGWPVGRVLELFEGPEPWGTSQRYGGDPATSAQAATIKITRRELLLGKLPRMLLAELSERERGTLLGSQAVAAGVDTEQLLRSRLADFALKRKPALAESLFRSGEPRQPVSTALEKRFPTLSRSAIREVMEQASPAERDQLAGGKGVAVRLDNLARTRAQQQRLNRAITGLHRQTLASFDSDRLGLRSLEHLPGWPKALRLEVRSDSVTGRLLDSLGPQDATERKCLVKTGDTYQAFDEQGEALNSTLPHGRNFFESIMHGLPDHARQALGLPQVSQFAELQRAVTGYASTHRQALFGFLKLRVPRSRPSLRLASGRVGYLLSGRGEGLGPQASLIARVRAIYPNISDNEAAIFIQDRQLSGETPQQIWHMIANRQRELEGLQTTLNHWVAGGGHSPQVAAALVSTWRQGLYRGAEPHAYLDLASVTDLPMLNADFSHVRSLRLRGAALVGEPGVALLRQFPKVKRLDLQIEQVQLGDVVDSLEPLSEVTELAIDGPQLSYSASLLQRINGLQRLERLTLTGAMDSLDVSALARLRTLTVSGSLAQWPVGVFGLEHLEALSLSGTQINYLAPPLMVGHERLWRGLHLKWSLFEPQAFMAVLDHVQSSTAHLVDEEQLVRGYCEGSLSAVKVGDSAFVHNTMAEFKRQGLSRRERVERVNLLREEFRALNEGLGSWQARESWVDRTLVDPFYRERAAAHILQCWRAGLDGRYATDGEVAGPSTRPGAAGTALDLSGGVLGDLPPLPAQGFGHVRHLNLSGTRLALPVLDALLRTCPNVRRLNLSGNNMLQLPASLKDLAALQYLDLSHNMLSVNATLQAQLSSLSRLERLSMRFNRIGRLDVSALTQLRHLDLSHSALQEWPAGVLRLPLLGELNLSHSALTQVPLEALGGHDLLMLRTNLRGCPLTAQACADVLVFSQRLYRDNPLHYLLDSQPQSALSAYTEKPLGIPSEHLAHGTTGGDPEYFPLEVAQAPNLLVPLPLDPLGAELRLTPAARLRRLDPALSELDAVRRIEQLAGQGLALHVEAWLRARTQQFNELVTRLNEWIDVRAYREGGGWISAVDRRRAADRILDSWRHNLTADPLLPAVDGRERLDFRELGLGDLPPMPPGQFRHVTELNLNGVKLTEQGSNDFLRGFTQTHRLNLNHNRLISLPHALSELTAIKHLEVAHNDLRTSPALQAQLDQLVQLESLDLSENTLEMLSIQSMPDLQSLNLHGNILEGWPVGVLEAPNLRALDLSNNQIESIPEQAFADQYQPLMRGTHLADNLLVETTLRNLREYTADTGIDLGVSPDDVDEWLDGQERSDEDDPVDVHPELLTPAEQKAQWFTGVPADSTRHALWDALKAMDGSDDFFYILTQLRNAKDFSSDKAELTRRVWEVLDAAHEYPALQDELFSKAQAMRVRVTCGDGWILLFSDLEVSVYEFKALKAVAPEQQGAGLLKLATGMIRLEAVEGVANTAIARRPDIDPAEIRLAYRIGLARRLELPRQPSTMLYRNLAQVTKADIDAAYTQILEKEATPGFNEQLVDRKYWVDHLKRQYPDEFAALTARHQVKVDVLETQYPDINPQYLKEIAALDTQNRNEQQTLAIELSARERTRLAQLS